MEGGVGELSPEREALPASLIPRGIIQGQMQAGKAQSCHTRMGLQARLLQQLCPSSAPHPSGTLPTSHSSSVPPPRFSPGMEASWEAPYGNQLYKVFSLSAPSLLGYFSPLSASYA